jgi:hypothetical protein
VAIKFESDFAAMAAFLDISAELFSLVGTTFWRYIDFIAHFTLS